MTVKELREFLEKYQDDDSVRFFTEKGTKEFQHVKVIRDDVLYQNGPAGTIVRKPTVMEFNWLANRIFLKSIAHLSLANKVSAIGYHMLKWQQ